MRNICCILLILISLSGTAQKPFFKFSLEGIGDNREFHNGQSMSQTIFGTLGKIEIGIKTDHNSLFAGISELYEFGSKINSQLPNLIMYYKFEDETKQFQFGSFPRLGTVDFPLAMLADTLAYYRPQIEGMSGKLNGKWGYQMAFVDWTGRQTNTVRESFMAGTSGEIKVKNWFLQNYFLLNHLALNAERPANQHIKDYFGFSFMTGINMGTEESLHGTLKGGLITSLYRERFVTGGFQTRNSFQFEGYGQYKNYAIRSTLHSGGELRFALGDPLYRLKNYLRTDAIWYFINFKNVKARFNWSFHLIEWKNMDYSQQLSLIYKL